MVEVQEAHPGERRRIQDRSWRRTTGNATTTICGENEYALIQYNFSLFFGIAIQLYEATLVSDDTPWDRFRREHPRRPIRR